MPSDTWLAKGSFTVNSSDDIVLYVEGVRLLEGTKPIRFEIDFNMDGKPDFKREMSVKYCDVDSVNPVDNAGFE